MEMLPLFAFLIFCHLVTSDIPNPDPLDFMTDAWPFKLKFASSYDTVIISCQTNQVYAKVYLYKRYNLRDAWRNALPNIRHMTIVGQTFYIKNLRIKDSGYYKCLAEKWDGETKELEKGQLVVSPVKKTRMPEIFPNDPVIKIDRNANRNITCKAIGARGSRSFVAWYRKGKNGELTKVDSSRVYSESELSHGNHVDIEKLSFNSFSKEAAGVYICQRRVYNAGPTQRAVRVEISSIFEFKTPRWHIGDRVPIKIALINDFVFISCQTSSIHADVILLRKRAHSAPWQLVETSDHGHIRRIGQTFLIKELSYTDSSFYKCRATNDGTTIEMEKGMLIASIIVYPSDHKDEDQSTNGIEGENGDGEDNAIPSTSRQTTNVGSDDELNFIPNVPISPVKRSSEEDNA